MRKVLKILCVSIMFMFVIQTGCSESTVKNSVGTSLQNGGQNEIEIEGEGDIEISTKTENIMLPSSAEYYLENENSNVIEAYKRIVCGIKNFCEKIDLNGLNITEEQLKNLYSLVNATYPEIININTSFDYSTSFSDEVKMVKPSYKMTKDEYERNLKTLEDIVNSIVSTADGCDDWKKAEIFHDAIVCRCVYDENAKNIYSAYGCLVENSAVCEGYAKAFQMMCDKAGIPCLCVYGSAFDENAENDSHMWNKVKINDEWYNVDTTWDDPKDNLDKTCIQYDYFMISDEEISVNHKVDDNGFKECPEALDSNNDYFDYYDIFISDVSQAKDKFYTAACMNFEKGNRFFEVRCSDRKVFDLVDNRLLKNVSKASALYSIIKDAEKETSLSVRDDSFNVAKNESMNTITISF